MKYNIPDSLISIRSGNVRSNVTTGYFIYSPSSSTTGSDSSTEVRLLVLIGVLTNSLCCCLFGVLASGPTELALTLRLTSLDAGCGDFASEPALVKRLLNNKYIQNKHKTKIHTYKSIINHYRYLLRVFVLLLSLEVLFLAFFVGVPTSDSMISLTSEDIELILERKVRRVSLIAELSIALARCLVILEVCVVLTMLESLKGDSGEDSFCLMFGLIRELRRSGESADITSILARVLRPYILKGR